MDAKKENKIDKAIFYTRRSGRTLKKHILHCNEGGKPTCKDAAKNIVSKMNSKNKAADKEEHGSK